MKKYQDISSQKALFELLETACTLDGAELVEITDSEKLQSDVIYTLQYHASVSENEEVKTACIYWIRKIAGAMNITTGSNVDFYDKKASGEYQFFTVPAVNLRMATFHKARALVRAADALELPHLVMELAVSEMGYTAQEKREFVALVKAAYISLGITDRTLYLQADHYQLDPKKYAEDSGKEMQRVKDLIAKAIEAGVYNIDIDASKFETDDPNKTDRENQAENARLTAELFHFIRQYERENDLPCVISVGGEVGEVGGENTKYPQVNAYLDMVREHMQELGSGDAKGLSKVSINVGSAHGGVLGPDGQPLDVVPLDFTAHHDLYMLGKDPMSSGEHVVTVQHGASTLPKKYFPLFPAMHVGEIHLATGFQNVVWSVLEKEDTTLFEKMKNLAHEHFAEKIAGHKTEAIGFMKERKRVTQFIKKDLLLSPAVPVIEKALETEFTEIFSSLYTLLLPKGGHVEEGDRED